MIIFSNKKSITFLNEKSILKIFVDEILIDDKKVSIEFARFRFCIL